MESHVANQNLLTEGMDRITKKVVKSVALPAPGVCVVSMHLYLRPQAGLISDI